MPPAKKRLSEKTNRRFQIYHHKPEDIQQTNPSDPCVIEKRTRYPKTVVKASDSPRILIGGHNNVKLGARIQKGAWAGMPLFSVTLEERKTCSDDCFMKVNCYGNSMHMARRHQHGAAFEDMLVLELADKAIDHPNGFVVRLHVLGDFYSLKYANLWHEMMERIPQLHVFGYTHRHPWAEDENDAMIGTAISDIKTIFPDRFRIRWSSKDSLPDGATVITKSFDGPIVPEGQICTTYIDPNASCATCAMCWSDSARDKTIVFPLHGLPKKNVSGATVARLPSAILKRNKHRLGRNDKET